MYEEAATRFVERAGQFSQLVFINDSEMEDLLGKEVMAAVAKLDVFGREQSLCTACEGTCCHDIGCELYSARFGTCPIHDHRPALCRLHFCHSFDAAGKSDIIRIRDIFLACLKALDHSNSPKRSSMEVPPFGEVCPDFAAVSLLWLQEAEEGRLDFDSAAQLIKQQAQRLRTARL